MNYTTLKTYYGFVLTMIGKYTPLNVGKSYLEGIYNYRKYNEFLSTSGQPTEAQFELIKKSGFTTVINLAPTDKNNYYKSSENSLKDEAGLLTSLGIEYIHIPVDFKYPSHNLFWKFSELLKSREAQKVWVHCAANMRVSAFLYRYRRDVLDMNDQEARKIMDTIWAPTNQWADFLDPSNASKGKTQEDLI